jgi:hypothetical protein
MAELARETSLLEAKVSDHRMMCFPVCWSQSFRQQLINALLLFAFTLTLEYSRRRRQKAKMTVRATSDFGYDSHGCRLIWVRRGKRSESEVMTATLTARSLSQTSEPNSQQPSRPEVSEHSPQHPRPPLECIGQRRVW